MLDRAGGDRRPGRRGRRRRVGDHVLGDEACAPQEAPEGRAASDCRAPKDLLRRGLRESPLRGDLLIDSIELVDSGFHDDPMDQMIVATALSLNLPLVTADRRIRTWADRTGRLEIVPLR